MTAPRPQLLRAARERLAREFPELAQAVPEVTPYGEKPGRYLAVFRGSVSVPGGRTLERIVRAVLDERGRILKWTTSR
jgi:hypothetical protein